MRVQIVADIDGTDEEQLRMLETLEEYAESGAVLGLYDHDERLDLDMVYVSVTEIPERQVRGPVTPKRRPYKDPRIGDLAWRKSGSLDPRPVVYINADHVWLEIAGSVAGPFDRSNYSYSATKRR